jgi:putative phosphoribosyl transferase
MIFRNREEAGQRLAVHLKKYAHRTDVIVLGVPRGGIPVAYEVAAAWSLPLDVFVLRKLGVPGHAELAFGAIGSGGVRFLNSQVVEQMGISAAEIAAVTGIEREELDRRERLYRGNRPSPDVHGKTVILVDDGVATGASLTAGIQALKQMRPAAIVVATPVIPRGTRDRLRGEVDAVVCVATPDPFYGVGQFYENFSQVSDKEVIELLERAWRVQVEIKETAGAVPGGAR